jgi:GxxExxY protein
MLEIEDEHPNKLLHRNRDEAQLLNVLKATGLKVGLLVNFGRTKVEYKRLVF